MKRVSLTSESNSFLDRNTDFLLRRGFHLFTETSGAKVLNLHKDHHFDLVIVDHKLEDMSGYTFCSQLLSSEHSKHPPVIIACHNSHENIRKATECKANSILLRPIDPKKLLSSVTNLIDLQVVRNRRVALKADVLCRKSGAEFNCISHDISNTGVLLESDQLNMGSRVTCEITLPDSIRVEAHGEVVRHTITRNGRCLWGIKFVNTPISSLRTIISYVVSTVTLAPNAEVPNYPGQHGIFA